MMMVRCVVCRVRSLRFHVVVRNGDLQRENACVKTERASFLFYSLIKLKTQIINLQWIKLSTINDCHNEGNNGKFWWNWWPYS